MRAKGNLVALMMFILFLLIFGSMFYTAPKHIDGVPYGIDARKQYFDNDIIIYRRDLHYYQQPEDIKD